MLQDEPIASELPQAFDAGTMAKSEGFAPVRLMTIPVSAAVPVFVSVTVASALVVFTSWLGNASGLGASDAMGAPVPGAAGCYSHRSLRSVELPLEFKYSPPNSQRLSLLSIQLDAPTRLPGMFPAAGTPSVP